MQPEAGDGGGARGVEPLPGASGRRYRRQPRHAVSDVLGRRARVSARAHRQQDEDPPPPQ